MSDITAIDQNFRLATNVEVGKFTCLTPDTSVYRDGCAVPGAANLPLLGVAQESILADPMADYTSGIYDIASGAAWPAGMPGAGLGRNVRSRLFGISRTVAAGPIPRGNFVNIAAPGSYGDYLSNAAGLVKAVDEANGALVNVIGMALDPAVNAGDVIRVFVNPYSAPNYNPQCAVYLSTGVELSSDQCDVQLAQTIVNAGLATVKTAGVTGYDAIQLKALSVSGYFAGPGMTNQVMFGTPVSLDTLFTAAYDNPSGSSTYGGITVQNSIALPCQGSYVSYPDGFWKVVYYIVLVAGILLYVAVLVAICL
jgi:hypothetical protein